MNLQVRQIRPNELPEVLKLYEHLHAEDEPLPDAATVTQVWNELCADPKLHCLIATVDDTPVASCILAVIPNLTRGARPYGLIENVVTHAGYRRQGIGTALLRHALTIAWEHNCYKVMLLTRRKDEGVLRFYEKAGFRQGVKTGFIAYPPQKKSTD
ncbi:MAG TPA: GNAT family N-acetyltransferase [Anaerolineae bacterium]|nr:GNAT family N-acetyltransferase [Anaerolineae bacterium]HQI85607.1 GNAT family N-acetyltransferase [Anaerolineae bacterium]